jgi:integrative and conjugative element protein (TIGR02256 family)
MCSLADWACPSTGVIVVLAPSVLRTFDKYIQNEEGKPESGGILLGLRRGAHLEVTNATVPTQFDKQSKFHFERDSKVHSHIATEMWRKSGGHITYIGEWHTHPENDPVPSSIDFHEWGKVTRGSPNQNSFVMITVGINRLWVGISLPDGSIRKLNSVK